MAELRFRLRLRPRKAGAPPTDFDGLDAAAREVYDFAQDHDLPVQKVEARILQLLRHETRPGEIQVVLETCEDPPGFRGHTKRAERRAVEADPER